MKNENREILGIEVQITGIAETLAELVSASGSEAAVVNACNANVLAHSHFTDVRKTIVAVLIKESGVPRLTKKHGEKEVFAESEAEYVARLESDLGSDGFAALIPAVQTAVAEMVVDYKPGTRGNGSTSAKPAKKWYAYVADLKKKGNFDAFCSKHGITAETEEELDDAVALKVKEIITEKEKKARAEAEAALG